MDITTLHNGLSSLDQHIPKQNVLIIGEDMNAQIGKNENNKFLLTQLAQTEIMNILQIFHSRTVLYAQTLNSKKRRENHRPIYTLVQKDKANMKKCRNLN